METVIGCTNKEGAKTLFSAPAISGEDFRSVVDIYACGTAPYLSKLISNYINKLVEQKDSDIYIVWAKSFMHGGHGRGPAGEYTDPAEFFDVAFCIPIETLDDDMIKEFEEVTAHGGLWGNRPPRGGCVPGNRPGPIRGHR